MSGPALTSRHATAPALPVPFMRAAARSVPVGVAVLLSLTILVALAALGSLRLGLALALVFVWFVVPGAVLAWRLCGAAPVRGWAAVLMGPIWGFAVSSLALFGLWAAGLRRPEWLLAVAPILAVLPALAVRPLAFTWPSFTRRDLVALLFVLQLVPLVVARPFSRVAEPLPDGLAYRAYFTADFVWRMAVVSEVSKGDVPPRNPFLTGERLHYYWLASLLPAVEHLQVRRFGTLEHLLLAHSILIGCTFLGFLYFFVRHFTSSAAAAALGLAFVVLCSSFEGLHELAVLWWFDRPLSLVRYVNTDAVSRWVYQSMPVDGLHRLLLYQPQHQVGYALGLSAILLAARAIEPTRPPLMFAIGSLLASALLMSSFAALMALVMATLWVCGRLIAARRWLSIPLCGLAGAIPLAGALALTRWMETVDGDGRQLVELMANPVAFRRPILALALSFGPPVCLGSIGAVLAWRARNRHLALPALVVLVSLFFYFFVDVRGHQHVYVGWRAGHFIFMAVVPLAALAFEHVTGLGRSRRLAATAGVAVLALAGAPTVAIDLYNTQDITNRDEAPGFRWTLIVTPQEQQALDWIKHFVPKDATVQPEPFVRDAETWAYVPAFAERRMAAGLPISMIPLHKYDVASRRIRRIFRADSARAAYDQCLRFGVDYLLVGPPERAAYPRIEAVLDGSPALFDRVFRNDAVSIYFVHPNRSGRVGRS